MADSTAYLNGLFSKGGEVRLAPMTYYVSGNLTIAVDRTSVIGPGAVFEKTAGCQISLSASWCLVEGITVNGNHHADSGIFVTGSFNTILRCRSEKNGDHGFAFDGGRLLPPSPDLSSTTCKFNEIRSCISASNGGIGISQYHHWDGRVVDNACFDNDLEGISVDVWSLRNLVTGNTLLHNCKAGGVGAIGIDYADLNRVTNNYIEQDQLLPGITLEGEAGQSNYNILSHNIIVNPSIGILLRASTMVSPVQPALQPVPRTANNNLVTDNLIRGAIDPNNPGVLVEAGCVGNDIRGNKVTS